MKKEKVREYFELVKLVYRPDIPAFAVSALTPYKVHWFGAKWGEIGAVIEAAAKMGGSVEAAIEFLTKLGVEWED